MNTTKTEVTHTPTPWRNKSGQVLANGLELVAQCEGKNTQEWEANAAFIVRAVNNFEALLDTLKTIRRECPVTQPWGNIAHRAIVLTEGRTKP